MNDSLPTPPADVKALIERVRSALAAHHDWHLQAGEMVIAKDENGEPIWLDLGLEYQDSSLYERTADAMTALASLSTGWRPTREQIAQIIEPLSWHAIGSHGISTHDARRALSLRKADAILALTPEAE